MADPKNQADQLKRISEEMQDIADSSGRTGGFG